MRLAALLLPLSLAACGGAIDLTNASIEEVARMTAAIDKPKPGQWKTDATLVSFVPPARVGAAQQGEVDAMKDQVGAITMTEACLDPEEAEKPLFGDLAPATGADCTFRRFRFDEGRLDATMTCRRADGVMLEVRQQGSYSAAAVDITSSVKRTGPNGAAQGAMTTKTVARRTGDCQPEA